MITAYVLVRNLDCADVRGGQPAKLKFKNFSIGKIPQFGGLNGDRLLQARELFRDTEVSFDDWVYERDYLSVPALSGAGPSGFGRIPQDIEDDLLLLRLFKTGDILFVKLKVRDDSGQVHTQLPYRAICDITIPGTHPYQFAQSECSQWDNFGSELVSTAAWTSRWFDVARRFFLYGGAKEFNWYVERQSNIEHNDVDRVVDYMIALEASLVPEHDFVGRRLRERAARLLDDDQGAQDKTKDLVRKFYDIRSTIAHGSPLSDQQRQALADHREAFERTVRDVLVAALKRLPADENKRRDRLAELWALTDKDRAAKLLQDFNSIASDEAKRSVSAAICGQ